MTAAAFYTGHVSHRRNSSPGHTLRYRLAYVLVDLDQLPEANRLSRYLGIGRSGLMSVVMKDHGDSRSNLAAFVRNLLRKHEVKEPAARIELLTLPRMFGYVFNPISVYFIYDRRGELHHVIYEVNNTFGERQFYLCPTLEERGVHRHSSDKAMYVSPFMNETGSYDFFMRPPAEKAALAIHYKDENGEEVLRAHLALRRKPVTDASALGILTQFPLMTLGVIAGIHWHAVKLLIKGAHYRFHKPRPAAAAVSLGRMPSRPLTGALEKEAA